MRRYNSLYFSYISTSEALRLVAHAAGALAAGTAFRHGDAIERFESQWKARFGCPYALGFPSARSALYSLLKAHGVGSGHEVILTGFTCVAVPDAVLYTGATPVYADIDPTSYTMRTDEVKTLFSGRTRAVVIQHTYGIPADVVAITELARRRGIFVIEDSALALGSAPGNKQLGHHGDAAVFSFELSKTISAGWGGLAQINRENDIDPIPQLEQIRKTAGILDRLSASRRLCQAGLSRFLYSPTVIRLGAYLLAALFKLGLFRRSAECRGSIGNPPEKFLAAQSGGHWRVLSSQLQRLDKAVQHSNQVTKLYSGILEERGIDQANPIRNSNGACLIRFPLQVRRPDRAIEFFGRRGIELGRWFDYPISERPVELSTYHYTIGQCPVAEQISQHVINLPVNSRISPNDVDRACTTLNRFLDCYPDEVDFIARSPLAATELSTR